MRKVILISSFLFFLVGIYSILGTTPYENVYVLPFAFSILLLLFLKSLVELQSSWVVKIVLSQMAIRYGLIPFYLSLGMTFTRETSVHLLDMSIVLMVIEMLLIFPIFYFAARKYQCFSNDKPLILLKTSKQFLLGVILIISFLYLYFKGYMFKVNFIWNLKDYWLDSDLRKAAKNVDGIDELLFMFARVLAVLFCLSIIKRRKLINNFWKWLISFLVIILNSAIIIGSSRFSIVFITFPSIIILSRLYPLYKKKLYLYGTIVFTGVIIITSLTKFSTNTYTADSSDVFGLKFLNSYFTGIGNTAVGIESYESSAKINHINYFTSDFFQNIPGLADLVDLRYKTSLVYNNTFYGLTVPNSDQIVPITSSALYHFGYSLFFVYSILFLFLAFYFERRMNTSQFIGSQFIYGLLALSCSLFMMLTFGSIISNVIKYIVFVLLPILFINDRLFFSDKKLKSKSEYYLNQKD